MLETLHEITILIIQHTLRDLKGNLAASTQQMATRGACLFFNEQIMILLLFLTKDGDPFLSWQQLNATQIILHFQYHCAATLQSGER